MQIKKYIPGVLLSLCIAVPAWFLGKTFSIIGGPVFAIVIGILAAFFKRPDYFQTGISFTSKKLLQYSIILIGFDMNLFNVIKVGRQSLFVMIFTLSAAFLTALAVGRLLRLRGKTSTLIGVGTAICGGSAIAAVAPVIKADDDDVAYSISTIFLFNIAAIFLFPAIGHMAHMTDTGFGMWAGTAINDTSSVVAAGFSWSDTAGNFATVVKLTRTLMIVPVALFLSIRESRKASEKSGFSFLKVFPWFVVGFVLTSILRTTGLLPVAATTFLAQCGKFVIIMAMAAVGLNTNLKKLIANGIRPILLGFSCWAAVAVVSILAQAVSNLL